MMQNTKLNNMEMMSSSKKPPRNLSKQKSCGNILHNDQGSERGGVKSRVCVTPNSKTTGHRRFQKSANTSSRSDLTKSCRNNIDSIRKNLRSGSTRTPVSAKSGVPGNTPRSTVVTPRTPSSFGSFKGKIKRDLDKGKDSFRPKKRLAILNQDEVVQYHIEDEGGTKPSEIEEKDPQNTLIPVAEIKPMPVVRNLCKDDCDMQDGIGHEVSTTESTKSNPIAEKTGHAVNHRGALSSFNSDSAADDFSVNVAVRVRPFTQREEQNKEVTCVVEFHENSICVTENNGNPHLFTYDISLWSFDKEDPQFASQEMVYKATAQPLLQGVLKGYNTCLFAYGQTGSGKSYTMTGYEDADAGIIPRFCEELFQRINRDSKVHFAVEISFFEIYNEKIRDLLIYSQENTKQLRIREHPEQGPYVQDLSVFTVTCCQDIEGWLAVGIKNRATAATGMNDRSSRSHSVFTILLNQSETEFYEDTETHLSRTSKVNLIDLAGSERANQVITDELAADYQAANSRLKEGSCINRSLHTLGKVISLLSERHTGPKKKLFIPYRDSTLTWLLKESLGGNSRTAMIATISPASTHVSETLSTLRYASQARNIVNQVRVNEDTNAKMIRELLREIDRLKSTKHGSEETCLENSKDEVEVLKAKLNESNAMLSRATKEWESKLKLSEIRWREETDRIKQSGLSTQIDNSSPSLVNLNEDPMLSEILVYVLKNGITTFGNSLSQGNYDIKLSGPLVADHHCYITNEHQKVTVLPAGDAPVYVNGEQISESVLLMHGDRIVIGGTHFFRFNHPIASTRNVTQTLKRKPSKRELRRKWDGLTLKDFEFAKRELSQQQNAKLEAELEDSQVKAQEGLIELITSAKDTAEKQLSLQRDAYKEEIAELQKNLEEAECKRRIAEKSKNLAEDKLIQLKSHKMALEEKIRNNRKKLQDEAVAAKKAFDETRENQLEIIAELEKEKRKIEDDVHNFKTKKLQRNLVRNEIRSALTTATGGETNGKKDLLKIALLLREANKISEKLKKNIMFSRDDILENDEVEIRIRLNDTKHGRTTLWSLDKFEIMVGKMRDLYQTNGILEDGEDDPFQDSIDEWMDDFALDSPNTPQPSLNGSRISIGRRFSFNHSLNLLTNLNASLSELSKRRKSSAIGNAIPADNFSERKDMSVPLAHVHSLINVESANKKGQTTSRHLLSILTDISSIVTALPKSAFDNAALAKQVLHIAVLLTRLKECAESWHRMQNVMGCASIDPFMNSLKSDISTLIEECGVIFQPTATFSGNSDRYSDRIVGSLMKVIESVGKSSLVSADYFEDTLNVLICPVKDPLACRSYIEGKHIVWQDLTSKWTTAVDDSLQELRNLQLETTERMDIDLDDVVNLLNSTITMVQHLRAFMECYFEVRLNNDDRRLLVTEKSVLVQRCVISNLTKLVRRIQSFVSRTNTTKAVTNDDIRPLHDRLHCIAKYCKNILTLFSSLVEQSLNSSATASMERSLQIKERFEKLEFTTKAVQVGVAVISQNLEELCFPAGEYSICLDSESEGVGGAICCEPVICPISLESCQDLA